MFTANLDAARLVLSGFFRVAAEDYSANPTDRRWDRMLDAATALRVFSLDPEGCMDRIGDQPPGAWVATLAPRAQSGQPVSLPPAVALGGFQPTEAMRVAGGSDLPATGHGTRPLSAIRAEVQAEQRTGTRAAWRE